MRMRITPRHVFLRGIRPTKYNAIHRCNALTTTQIACGKQPKPCTCDGGGGHHNTISEQFHMFAREPCSVWKGFSLWCIAFPTTTCYRLVYLCDIRHIPMPFHFKFSLFFCLCQNSSNAEGLSPLAFFVHATFGCMKHIHTTEMLLPEGKPL